MNKNIWPKTIHTKFIDFILQKKCFKKKDWFLHCSLILSMSCLLSMLGKRPVFLLSLLLYNSALVKFTKFSCLRMQCRMLVVFFRSFISLLFLVRFIFFFDLNDSKYVDDICTGRYFYLMNFQKAYVFIKKN